MSAKTGRPTNSPKRHETRIRLSDEDVAKLLYCCKALGVTRSEIIRRGVRLIYSVLATPNENKNHKNQK